MLGVGPERLYLEVLCKLLAVIWVPNARSGTKHHPANTGNATPQLPLYADQNDMLVPIVFSHQRSVHALEGGSGDSTSPLFCGRNQHRSANIG